MKKTMNDYILETPDTVLNNLNNADLLTKSIIDLYFDKDYKSICIIASGSSFNASHCARMFMRSILNCEVKIITPYTFENYEYRFLEDSFTVVISQSGCSTNAISALTKLKSVGKPSIGITGNPESDFKNVADYTLDYGVGIETVGYVTKGVVTLVEYLILFALKVALRKGTISLDRYNKYLSDIMLSAQAHRSIYKSTQSFINNNFKQLSSMENAYICACGPNYGTALEGALKIGETIHIPAIAYEVEELLHGPNIQLTPNYTLFFIDNNDHTSKRTLDIYNAIRCITDKAYIITNNKEVDNNHAIRCDISTDILVSPLYNLAVFELIAFTITESLNAWRKHPLFYTFEKKISCKSKMYKSNEV